MPIGIWKHKNLTTKIKPAYRLTTGEGNTVLSQIDFRAQKILLKREDLNPNSSFKDRSLAYQLSYYRQQNKTNFVISSSGNAAISAIAYSALFDAKLTVFVSEKIPKYKFHRLVNISKKKLTTEIQKSKRPKSDAIKFARENNAINLRGSTDDNATDGFKTIAYELHVQNPNIDAIFICCSSGTSTVGIYEGYKEITNEQITKIPQIHIVQSTKIHPISKKFKNRFTQTNTSLADAITDRVARRKQEVLRIVNETNGYGWVVSDQEILEARNILNQKDINIEGYNSYVSFAGYIKAIKHKHKSKNPTCILSGL